MATVDMLMPAYRSVQPDTWNTFITALRATECTCTDTNTGQRLHAPWECNRGKHSVFSRRHVQSCVVHWARNKLIAEFLWEPGPPGRPPAEYALLMDDDMAIEPHYISRLLSHKLDFVTGICTNRRDPAMPTIKRYDPQTKAYGDILEWDWDSEKLVEVDASGLAFALIHRRVFEAINEAFLSCRFEREADHERYPDQTEKVNKVWDEKAAIRHGRHEQTLDKCRVEGKDFENASCWWTQFTWDPQGAERAEMGEDVSFCYKAKKLGFRIFADPQVLPGHIGDYAYSIRDWRAHVEELKVQGLWKEQPVNMPSLKPLAAVEAG
jgi:hypothetical protein